jgi:signal transduction histidine kinase
VLGAVRTDVDELTHLMTELVELATDRSSDEPVVAVDLTDLAASVAARSRRRSGRTIELTVEGEGTVQARAQMVERAIGNLVDNAVKYSPAPTVIEIHVGPDTVEVRDHGHGIAPAEHDRVFERFYRSDATRTSPGSGLGLAIVQQIVERHGGRVWARTGPDGGAWVGFELPRRRPRRASGPRGGRSGRDARRPGSPCNPPHGPVGGTAVHPGQRATMTGSRRPGSTAGCGPCGSLRAAARRRPSAGQVTCA